MKKLLLLLVFVLFQTSCSKKTEAENEKIITDSIINELNKTELTEVEKFLLENDFKTDAEFTDSQFKEFKNLIESGAFKDESFCDVFQKSLDITNNSKNYKQDLKKLFSKYKDIPYIEDLVMMYGWKVCQPKKNNSNKNNYVHSSDANPCIISEDFIKDDLYNPETASFSSFNCSNEENSDGTYTILRKVSASNKLGIETEFIYKVKIGFKGGNWVDIDNWDLISIQSEEYRK